MTFDMMHGSGESKKGNFDVCIKLTGSEPKNEVLQGVLVKLIQETVCTSTEVLSEDHMKSLIEAQIIKEQVERAQTKKTKRGSKVQSHIRL